MRQIGTEPATIVPPEIDETPFRGELPADYALRVALAKAEAVRALYPNGFVLAADTAVARGRRILPAPEDEAAARWCLEMLSGSAHRVYGAVAVLTPEGRKRVRLAITRVTFKRLSQEEIARYLASREWRDKAGGYAIQGRAATFVRRINGSYSNVVGLPLYETAALLPGLGFQLP